jgi:hypothetical protein
MDADGLAELLVAVDPRVNASAPRVEAPVRLWYGDVIAKARAGRLPVDDRNASPLDPPRDSALIWRSAKFAGDLNGDGELDLVLGATQADEARPAGEFTILF